MKTRVRREKEWKDKDDDAVPPALRFLSLQVVAAMYNFKTESRLFVRSQSGPSSGA